jgi:hypothetical protein
VKRVAVVGASSNPGKFGNQAVRALNRQGYDVIPVNRHETEIEGLTTYHSVLDIPGEVDMVTIYVPPAEALDVICQVAEKKIPEVWLNPGADAPEVILRARELGLEPIVACNLMAIGAAAQGG